jgi:hypothetical protein
VIPIAHGKKLAGAATSRMQFIAVPNAGHMDIPDQLVIKAMLDFFQE